MKRLMTLGLAVFLACAPAFSGHSPAQGPPLPQGLPLGPSQLLANHLITATDDFIVDVYHNGVKVPDDRRELLNEIHGATVERIKVDVRPGDWLVFNVVNNRMRWGGGSYFGVAARGDSGVAFTTDLDSGRWSCCDDLKEVARFIADRNALDDHRALPIANPWGDGDSLMEHHSDGWKGRPIWGGSRNTWIKFIAR